MTDLNLVSLSVRGLGNCQKRREVFNSLIAKGFSIYFLQETHSSEKSMPFWLAEWGYKALFNSWSSVIAGVAILINNNFPFESERSFTDSEGRFIICDIKVDRKVITLANIYPPYEDNPQFFEAILNHLEVFKSEKIIIGGNFNLEMKVRSSQLCLRFQ